MFRQFYGRNLHAKYAQNRQICIQPTWKNTWTLKGGITEDRKIRTEETETDKFIYGRSKRCCFLI